MTTTETTTTLDAVFATGHDGRVYRVSDPVSYGRALAIWIELDMIRFKGRMPHVKLFEVRSVFLGPDRPIVGPAITSHGRYNGALLDLTYARPVAEGSRGFKSAENAARAAWRRDFPTYRSAYDKRVGNREGTGEQGLGGWYYWPNGQTAAQGLRSLAVVCERRNMIVQGGNGRWYVVVAS